MTTLTAFLKTNGVDDVTAETIDTLIASNLVAAQTNIYTLAATLALTDGDCALQWLDCNGAGRDVKLPAEASTNHIMAIYNASAGAYTIAVKDDSGVTTIATIAQGEMKIFLSNGTAWKTLTIGAGGGALGDGDKGDITVSGSGSVWTIDNGVVTLAKMADMATASLLGRNTAGTGAPEVLSAATVRTLLGAGYVIGVGGGGMTVDPVDATTYYSGASMASNAFNIGTIAAVRKKYVLRSGVVKAAYLFWRAYTVAGSNENISVYFRLNDATDTLIATVGDTNASKTFSNTALAIAVTQGDFFEIKIVCPTWATNPTVVAITGDVYIE